MNDEVGAIIALLAVLVLWGAFVLGGGGTGNPRRNWRYERMACRAQDESKAECKACGCAWCEDVLAKMLPRTPPKPYNPNDHKEPFR